MLTYKNNRIFQKLAQKWKNCSNSLSAIIWHFALYSTIHSYILRPKLWEYMNWKNTELLLTRFVWQNRLYFNPSTVSIAKAKFRTHWNEGKKIILFIFIWCAVGILLHWEERSSCALKSRKQNVFNCSIGVSHSKSGEFITMKTQEIFFHTSQIQFISNSDYINIWEMDKLRLCNDIYMPFASNQNGFLSFCNENRIT